MVVACYDHVLRCQHLCRNKFEDLSVPQTSPALPTFAEKHVGGQDKSLRCSQGLCEQHRNEKKRFLASHCKILLLTLKVSPKTGYSTALNDCRPGPDEWRLLLLQYAPVQAKVDLPVNVQPNQSNFWKRSTSIWYPTPCDMESQGRACLFSRTDVSSEFLRKSKVCNFCLGTCFSQRTAGNWSKHRVLITQT